MSESNLIHALGALPHSTQPGVAKGAEVSPVDDALSALSGELRGKLAALASTPTDGIELAIGLLPYGHRAVLESYQLITTSISRSARREDDDEENPRLQVHLTDLGHEVIEACANTQPGVQELVERAQALHRQFSDRLELETEEPAG